MIKKVLIEKTVLVEWKTSFSWKKNPVLTDKTVLLSDKRVY